MESVFFLQGAEACVLGALRAGMTFFAGYPITPSTEIAENASARLKELPGGHFIQMEDEIASLAAVLGASLVGAHAMTATSGPGLSLMQELISYGCAAEIPCVIINVMRGGPSTGLPTLPSQSDVLAAAYGAHGDTFPIILCPASVQEMHDLTIRAFELAHRFRTPVILLCDECVAHLREKIRLPKYPAAQQQTFFQPLLGIGKRVSITGLIHGEDGFPTIHPDTVQTFQERLKTKITSFLSDIEQTESFFLEDAECAVIAYGITTRSALHAVKMARQQGLRAGLLQLKTLFPFPKQTLSRLAQQCKRLLVAEMNMGQLVLEVERGVKADATVTACLQANGEIMTPAHLLRALKGGV